MKIINSFEKQVVGVVRDGEVQIATGETVPVYKMLYPFQSVSPIRWVNKYI